MSDSIVSMIFLGILGFLFVLLVVLTIVLIVTRKKRDYDEYEEDSASFDDGNIDEESNEYADYQKTSDYYNEGEQFFGENDDSEDYYDELNEVEETVNDDEAIGYNELSADEQTKDTDENEDFSIENESIKENAGMEDNASNVDIKVSDKDKDEDKIFVSEEKEAVNDDPDIKVYRDEMGDYSDSAFAPFKENDVISNEDAIIASVKEAEAMSEAVMYGKLDAETMFGISDQLDSFKKKTVKRSTVSSNDDFYWFNKMDVAEKPSYKTKEMYYHYFNLPKDCIEDLLVEMYDCALVRTEEIRYIAYGIEPKAVSIKDILSEGNYYYSNQPKKKEPLPQDLIKIYEKWCGYVEKLLDKVEIHADEFTIQEIKKMLCEFGRNDVDVLIEGK